MATKANLAKRRCSDSDQCPTCQGSTESTIHCLFWCPHARNTWLRLAPSVSLPGRADHFADWFFSLQASAQVASLSRVAAICWNVWKARNELVFRNVKPTHYITDMGVNKDMLEWDKALHHVTSSTITNHSPTCPQQICPPPITPTRSIYCDGSFICDSQKAAYGVIIKDIHGNICEGKNGSFFCSSATSAEARAILEAARVAASFEEPVVIFSDCITIINILNDRSLPWPWDCYALLGSVFQIKDSVPGIKFAFTPRKHNKDADWVATSTRAQVILPNWVSSLACTNH